MDSLLTSRMDGVLPCTDIILELLLALIVLFSTDGIAKVCSNF